MSRHPREYPVADRYDDSQSEFYRRPRRDRDYDDLEVDITRERYPEERRQRPETLVKERDSVVSERRGPRQPDFLREDYGKSTTAGALVVREERREDDSHSRVSRRRRSLESARSRPPPERTEEETKIVFRERERERVPPYPQSQVDDKEEIIYRERTRSRPPPREKGGEKEEIDIRISRDERESRPSPPRSEAPPVEEIRFRRGGGDRPGPPQKTVERTEIDIRERERSAAPPARSRVEREEIDIRERHSPAPRPPRSERGEVDREEIIFRERRSPPSRGRETFQEIDIRESSAPPPRHRSMSRPQLVARKEEEWVVRRPRTPSPPPPRDYEKEEIIIRRRKERTPSPEPEPEPPREPTPEPSPPPPQLEPIYRPPIIQEVITHHRHIDHGVERARSPTPPPPPAPAAPSPPPEVKEENLEIEIRRKGMRNGKAYEEDFTFEKDSWEREDRAVERRRSVSVDRKRSMSVATRRRSPSRDRRRYEDELDEEAEYYNRKISSRAYPGEAYNGATRDWSLVDVPPGTERVRMDGVGGGAQEITWQRYNGERRGKFISGDRVYEAPYGNGHSHASPPPALPAPAPAPAREKSRDTREEIKITMDRRTGGGDDRHHHHHKKRDKMWTEVTRDLVIKEAIEEMGYEYEESDEHFYVMEYLKYEDVLHLVQVTEEIKKERRERIREIQWQREERERAQPKALLPPPPFPPPPRSVYDERIYEREYIIDRDGRRFRR
ncbi:hypothetical protein Slin15195_G055100 [Septoria linicola]|uniref:DUF8035 domain-containing protein n=1 Tax=Septoria linicola TaxID=215465 RepID=A0A9Q9AUK9_9PEZI|nr:hypothetical protein Slin14017_G070960 [Septoria linicola]USW52191.1 hypothetical protein Slin15195_G055100 [Septoria linicola]